MTIYSKQQRSLHQTTVGNRRQQNKTLFILSVRAYYEEVLQTTVLPPFSTSITRRPLFSHWFVSNNLQYIERGLLLARYQLFPKSNDLWSLASRFTLPLERRLQLNYQPMIMDRFFSNSTTLSLLDKMSAFCNLCRSF